MTGPVVGLSADPPLHTETGALIAAISQWIDDSYPPDLDPEAHMWRRVRKTVNETGEAFDAIEGAIGENPRKGFFADWDDVKREQLDIALAALGAYEHLDGNRGTAWVALAAHVGRVATRAGVAVVPVAAGGPNE